MLSSALHPAEAESKNYYKVLGLKNFASAQEIRRACTIKQTEIKQKLEPENAAIAQKLQKANKDYPVETRTEMNRLELAKYESDIELNNQKIDDINNACDVLQDTRKKEQHDKNMPFEETPEALKRCWNLEKEVVNDNELLKLARRRNPEIRKRMGNCPMPKWPQYDGQKEEFLRERAIYYGGKLGAFETPEAGQTELGGIRSKIEFARRSGLDVRLGNLIGGALVSMTKDQIPDVGGKVFGQDMAIKELNFIEAPSGLGVRNGLGFTGTLQFNQVDVKCTVFVIETQRHTIGFSVSIALPENYKISNLFPDFKELDKLSLPQAKLVLSTFEYTDSDSFSIKYGLNFISRLDLSGPLKMLDEIKNKLKGLDAVITSIEPIKFQGVIPKDIKKVEFTALIPLKFGVNFTKIPKMPASITDIFKEFTTSDINLKVTAVPKVSFSADAGVCLLLGTQKAPLCLTCPFVITPTNLTIGVQLKNMLELKYFALGNAGVQVDFDEGLLPAAAMLGIPFTGMGVRGELDLGMKGENRVNLKLAGAARVTSSSIPDIMFDAEANNLKFGNLLVLYNSIIKRLNIPGTAPIPETKIPIMNIDKLKGYIALEDILVAGREYKAGFKFAVDAQLFDKKFGFDFNLQHKELKCSGSGYIPRIDVEKKDSSGKKVRIFTLAGIDKTDIGPNLYFSFNARNIAASSLGLSFFLEVPSIDLKNKAELDFSGSGFRGDVEMTYAGFTAIFGLDFDPNAMADSILKFGFKGDFDKFLSEQAMPALNRLSKQADSSLRKLDAAIGDLSRELGQLRKTALSKTDDEIEKTRDTIRRIEGKIDKLDQECKNAGKLKKFVVCPRTGLEIAAQGTALVAQKGYLEGLLKPGKQVINVSTKTLEDITKKLSEAEVTRKSVATLLDGVGQALSGISQGLKIFRVTKAIGEVSGSDIVSGKFPRLVELEAEVNIPELDPLVVSLANLQFDFKNPVKTGLNIVEKLLEGITIRSED